jgi:hypothetical protein
MHIFILFCGAFVFHFTSSIACGLLFCYVLTTTSIAWGMGFGLFGVIAMSMAIGAFMGVKAC